MRIRHYTPSDFRTVLRIFHRAVHQGCAPHCTPAQLAAWAPAPANVVKWTTALASGLTWVVCDADGEPRGFVQIGRDGTIGHLYVDPDHARRGLGAHLLHTALAWASDERMASVRVDVPMPARRFFEHHGFAQIADREGPRRVAPTPSSAMRKSLLATASAN